MKNIINTLSILSLIALLTACNNSNEKQEVQPSPIPSEVPDPASMPTATPTPTPTPSVKQILPTCSIEEGTPKTDTSMVVHVKCKKGNVRINEATVTLDNQVKPVDYTGVSIDDYLGFRDLQPLTTYNAILEVIVGGETLRDNVVVKTEREVPEMPIGNISVPVWTKDSYRNIIVNSSDLNPDTVVLDLNNVCSTDDKSVIKFYIIKVSCILPLPVVPPAVNEECEKSDNLFIENGKLKINKNFNYYEEDISIYIRASSKGGKSDALVNFRLIPVHP